MMAFCDWLIEISMKYNYSSELLRLDICGGCVMLILQRKLGQEIVLPTCSLTLTVLDIAGGKVSFGISAPRNVTVHRKEVWKRIRNKKSDGKEEIINAQSRVNR